MSGTRHRFFGSSSRGSSSSSFLPRAAGRVGALDALSWPLLPASGGGGGGNALIQSLKGFPSEAASDGDAASGTIASGDVMGVFTTFRSNGAGAEKYPGAATCVLPRRDGNGESVEGSGSGEGNQAEATGGCRYFTNFSVDFQLYNIIETLPIPL